MAVDRVRELAAENAAVLARVEILGLTVGGAGFFAWAHEKGLLP